MWALSSENCPISTKKFRSLCCQYFLEDTHKNYSVIFPQRFLSPHFATFIFNFQIVRAVCLLLISCYTRSIPYSENSLSYLADSYQRCTRLLFIFCLSSNVFLKLLAFLLGQSIPLLSACTTFWLDHL